MQQGRLLRREGEPTLAEMLRRSRGFAGGMTEAPAAS
jgi:hypothetical protein